MSKFKQNKIITMCFIILVALFMSPSLVYGFEVTNFTGNDPTYGFCAKGEGLFCTQHGTSFGDWTEKGVGDALHYSDAQAKVAEVNESGETFHGTPDDHELVGARTYPQLINPQNIDLSQHLDLAYLLSDPSVSPQQKQNAVWTTNIGSVGTETPPSTSYTNQLQGEMPSYTGFYTSISGNISATTGKESIILGQNQNLNTKVIANYLNQTLTVGPFSVNFINGGASGVEFGGISRMYFEGFNSKGNKVKEIDIHQYGTNVATVNVQINGFQPNAQMVDRSGTSYPNPGENFYVTIPNPNQGLNNASEDNYVVTLKLWIEFQWMKIDTSVKVTKYEGWAYEVTQDNVKVGTHKDSYPVRDGVDEEGKPKYKDVEYTCHDYKRTLSLVGEKLQDHIQVDVDVRREIIKEKVPIDTLVDIRMNLGGQVWEDIPEGKDGETNTGLYNANDRVIPNVKVTLYTEDGQVATLLSNVASATDDIMSRINPTYTDSNGDYLFKGLDPLQKYYVQFEYNGQIYQPTTYNLNILDYNSQKWQITSKGTETDSEDTGQGDSRTNRYLYNNKFSEIGSSPSNYESSNSLGICIQGKDGKYYNEAFSQHELMGFILDAYGAYHQGTRLIDGFIKIEGGLIVDDETEKEIQEGVISKKIKEFIDQNINQNKKSLSREDMISIYNDIIKEYQSDKNIAKKLQFIDDVYMCSYTQAQGKAHDLYPVYDIFLINNTKDAYNTAEEARNAKYEPSTEAISFPPIYPGQFYINQGLKAREKVDIALTKDILYAATTINGKTEIYEYNKRDELTAIQKAELQRLLDIYEGNGRQNPQEYQDYLDKNEEFKQTGKPYWEIQLRMKDYEKYYGGNYTRELYSADYNYRISDNGVTNPGNELELYVTYKITISNSSENILGEITEVVDYYDNDYEYCDDLSWIMYEGDKDENGKRHLEEVNFVEKDYYDTIQNGRLSGNIGTYQKDIKKKDDKYDSSKGQYIEEISDDCKSDMTQDYKALYIRGLQGKKLASGDEAYIYLTFKVKKENGAIITDEGDKPLKQNYAEINGYKTYYTDGTKLPNGITKNSSDVAGIIDVNSTPGNLCKEDITSVEDGRYEQNFENDTDRAKSIKVIAKEDFVRSIKGTVWEDKRTKEVSGAMIGDGIRTEEDEVKVAGVTVELVERRADGSLYPWKTKTTTTKADGTYEFTYIIPGNYFVRFKYGDTLDTVNTDKHGGKNKTSYNGQDFKSTVYQKDMNDANTQLTKYNGTKVKGYEEMYVDKENKYNMNVGYYDIKQLDKLSGENGNGTNFSDAQDIWQARQNVINYSSNNGNGVTNELAEILASPYTTPYNDANIEDLRKYTNMTAVTGLMVLEGEYDRTSTDGDSKVSNGSEEYRNGNDYNGKYTVNGVDFGITERPKAQLELDKKITNVKVILANGRVQFDANNGMQDVLWDNKHQTYNLNPGRKYNEYYGDNHRYAYREEIKEKINNIFKTNNSPNGLVVVTLDDELMQGATIQISYALTVKNVGETDYYNESQEANFARTGEGESFYYKGTGAKPSYKVTTSAEVVADYVGNNLSFKKESNTRWNITENAISTLGLKPKIATNVAKFNNIISTQSLKKALAPGGNATANLVLTQLINPQNSDDDRSYENMAEITTISNTAGRRMAFSIQGNQDPTQTPTEVDSSKSERVTILPPFGIGNIIVYIVLAASILIILVAGVILIKKKVLS